MWTTYIVPKLTYGLEVQRLTKMDIEKLEISKENAWGKNKVYQINVRIRFLLGFWVFYQYIP